MGVQNNGGKKDFNNKKPFFYYYFLVLLIVMVLNALVIPMMTNHSVEVPFNEFTKQLDAGNVEDVYVDNAFVLYTSVSLMEDGVHKDVGLSSGSGYYISKGTAQSISWSKGNAGDRLTFTDASGRELLVNPGKSGIIFTGSSPSRTQFS